MLPNSTVLLVYLLAVHILVGAVIGVLGGLALQLLDGISLRFWKDAISGGGGFVIGSIVGPVASSRLSSWNYFQLRRESGWCGLRPGIQASTGEAAQEPAKKNKKYLSRLSEFSRFLGEDGFREKPQGVTAFQRETAAHPCGFFHFSL